MQITLRVLYTSCSEHWVKKKKREREKRVKEGQSERDESKQKHETEKTTKGQDDYFNLLESKNSLR